MFKLGGKVTGTYEWDNGKISGTVSGDTLEGTWSQAPTHSSPDDTGEIRFKMSPDCNSFEGKWRYDPDSWWSFLGWSSWQGKKVLAVSGVVKDWKTGMPLPGIGFHYYDTTECDALSCDKEYKDIFFTDENGQFSINARKAGKYIRIVSTVYNTGYNGYINRFEAPTQDVVITLIPFDMQEFALIVIKSGVVEVRHPESGEWTAAVEGTILTSGMRLRTDEDAEATIYMPGKGIVRIAPFSIFDYRTDDDEGKTILDFIKGMFEVKSCGKNEDPFEIKSSAAIAGVMGTEFRYEVTDEGDIIEMFEGTLDVRPNASLDTVISVNAGERLIVHGDKTSLEQLTDDELAEIDSKLEDLRFFLEPRVRINFNDGQAQNWIDDNSSCWSISDRTLVMAGNKADVVRDTFYDQEFCDFTYQANMRKVAGDSNDSVFGYGLLLRSDGTPNNYYEFFILKDGHYQIAKGVDGTFERLVGWNSSDALNTGYNQWNTLKVVAKGSTIKFYANGKLLDIIEDTTHSCGKLGLFAVDAASSTDPDRVEFDNVLIIPESGSNGTDNGENSSDEGAVEIGDAKTWYNKGVTLDNSGMYEEAIGCYDKAIEIDPRYAKALNNKGADLLSLDNYDDAIKCFDQAVDIDPYYAEAWNNKGVALGYLGAFEDAIKCFEKAIEIDTFYREAWSNKGRALQKLGRNTEAQAAYNKAAELKGRG